MTSRADQGGGRLFAVVGPSGAGKDTLLEAMCSARPELFRARRVITRAADAGGEEFDGVDERTFREMRRAGGFAFTWRAHGRFYGIPRGIDEALGAGRTVLFNGSRAALPKAAAAYPGLQVLHVTARAGTLARRLARRGRESEAEIAARLERAGYGLPGGLPVTRIDNDGALGDAVAQALSVVQAPSA